jgi:hypothetical protein
MQPTQAYDLLNVTFDERGGVRQRPGYAAFGPVTLINGAVSSGASTLTVDSTDSFASAGTLVIGSLTVAYTGKTSTTFTGCTGVTANIADNATVTGGATNRYDSLSAFYTTGGTRQLVCGAGNRLEVYSTNGEIVGSARTTGVTASPHYFARFGGPTSQVIFAANGTDTIQRWDGSNWSNTGYTGFTPDGRFLTVTPWDNRLVNAYFANSVAGDNSSTVRFSNPSVPTTFETDNWVDLNPGDGEKIMGVAAFDNYVLVFKETRFFVFYGTTLDSDGNPEFNYRAVEAGKGLAAPGALCVGPDGVYFLAQDGVYRTNGGYPQLVSELLNPLFVGAAPDLYSGNTIGFGSIEKARMLYHNQQVYLAVPTGASSFNNRLFVFDPRDNWWTVWDVQAAALASFKISSSPDLVFSYADGYKRIGRVQDGLGSDAARSATASTTIYSFVKTAFNDFGSAVHKTVRESKVWGSGDIRFALNDDFSSSVQVKEVSLAGTFDKWQGNEGGPDTWGDGTGSDTWGRPAANRPRLVRQGVRGAYVGIEIYNSSASPGAWRVSKVIHHLREQRIPSVTRLDGE